MIEGLIIVGVAAIIIVVALWGTTLYASATAAIASVTAMVTSAITGTANLLTAWWYWAIATDITTYYVGWFWLATWLSLFAYSSFKIATSDKKKWMNLVGRGSNYLGVVLILFLVAQPLAVSYGATFLADTTAYTEVLNNSNDFRANYVPIAGKTNTTATYTEINDAGTVYDNDTSVLTNAALQFDVVTSATYAYISVHYNLQPWENISISKIVVTWEYIGTGNLTDLTCAPDDASLGSATLYQWSVENPTLDVTEADTVTILPEVFQAAQIKARTWMVVSFTYVNAGALPSTGDYIALSMRVYSTATIMTQETIMMWFAAIMALVDLIGLLYASGAMQKYIL